MFPARYFAERQFPPRYWPSEGEAAEPPTASSVEYAARGGLLHWRSRGGAQPIDVIEFSARGALLHWRSSGLSRDPGFAAEGNDLEFRAKGG